MKEKKIFKLSEISLNELEGVDPTLIDIVKRAIKITRVDFKVLDGLRTEEEQKEYVRTGKSHTMKSKHLTGNAVDLGAWVNGKVHWEFLLYDDIAEAIKKALIAYNLQAALKGKKKRMIRWGGAWQVKDIAFWTGPLHKAQEKYIDLRRSSRQRAFIDAGHFELNNPPD